MPIYEYVCEKCGNQLEVMQKMSDKPLARCPKCKGKLEKIFSQTSFQLKGSGWYVSDYAGKGKAEKGEKGEKTEPTEKTEKTEKPETTDKAAPADPAKKTETADKAAGPDKSDKTEKPAKTEKKKASGPGAS